MTSLNPLHTIEKQIAEDPRSAPGRDGPAQARTRVLELLRQVGIREPGKAAESLSARAFRRPAPARHDRHGARQPSPNVLIADEPTTALDVTVQAQILDLLREPAKARYGMALLFITHDLGVVRKFADRVCVMTKGEDCRDAARPRRCSAIRSTPTRATCSPRSRKGDEPPAADPSEPLVMEGSRYPGLVPDQGRHCCAAVVDHVKAVDGIESLAARRPDARGCRRIRLGQDDARPGARPADLHPRGASASSGKEIAGLCSSREMRPLRNAAAGRLPGPLRLAQPAHVGRRDHRGRAESA